MNRITATVVTLAAATGVVLGAATTAQAKPAVCADISVPAKVRADAGCFAPDGGPVAPSGTGDSPTVESPPTVRTPWTWTFVLPEPPAPVEEEEPTEEPPVDPDAPVEAS